MEVIQLGGYTEEEKVQIAERHLVPKQVEEHGLTRKQIAFSTGSVRDLARFYTREAGVRNLEREIGSVVRRGTRMVAEGFTGKVTVNRKFIESALGAPRFLHDEVMERHLEAGTAVGLAWTPVGGDVLFIESSKMPGHKGLVVTGQLGDVMKESVLGGAQLCTKATRATSKLTLISMKKWRSTFMCRRVLCPKTGQVRA